MPEIEKLDREKRERFVKSWTMDKLIEFAKGWKTVETIPVDVEVKAQHLVLNFDNVKEYLTTASTLALGDCVCRPRVQNCDAPTESTCIYRNEAAERILVSEEKAFRHPKPTGIDEAMQILHRTHEAGLVPMALSIGEDREPEDIGVICNCCSCCCAPLGGILQQGLAPHLLTSSAISVTDSSVCNDCGICVQRCQFGARRIVDGTLAVDQKWCMGCGLCTSTCPESAIKLVHKG